MKKLSFLIALLILCCTASAQFQTGAFAEGESFQNPIFTGDHPDPSILKDGDDYYIVFSSFEYYPGLPIWHSKDLVNWNPVVNALHTNVGDVWAPDIAKVNDKYYIYFPVENTNYVVWANSIEGPWSEPIDLKIGHIDPGHAVDADGKRYLYFSSGGYVQLSDDGLSVVGQYTHAYDGWEIPRDWSIELFALEGPKISKRGDYYYLTVAEGGTAGPPTGHMIISARSKSPLGPWENSPYNPIVRTTTDTERWCSKGHGTLVDDKEGRSWLVFHAYERGFYNMGRQTLLEPVEWTADGWFKTPEGVETDKPMLRPKGEVTVSKYSLSDSFDNKSLKPQWQFFGSYEPSRIDFVDNALRLKGKGTSIADCAPMLCIPSDHSYTAEVEAEIEGDAQVGMTLFYNNSFHSGILAGDGHIYANLRGWQFPTEKNVVGNRIFLKMRNIKSVVDMYYSLDGKEWKKIESSIEVSGMHHNVLSGFLSLRLGLCSIGEGSVKFKNFVYTPIN